MNFLRTSFTIACVVCLAAGAAFGQAVSPSFKTGDVQLQSVSQLAFGPEGILFIGDSLRGAIYAIDTQDKSRAASPFKLEIDAIDQKIGAQLGTTADQILINDIKVNPLSQKVFIAVSRGRGPEGTPVILQVDGSGRMTGFSLNHVRYSMVSLADSPASMPDAPLRKTPEGPRSGNPRVETITDMAYVSGKIIIAGLSNEEFSSSLRSIPFPFQAAEKGTSIQIWHSSHGRYETQAPVRTFIPYSVNRQQHILAAYTCTPLVKVPLSDLKPGSKVIGTTIAELGDSNRPLEMLAYTKEGHDYILMANSTRGVMRLSADNLENYQGIKPPTANCQQAIEPARGPKECVGEITGVPYQTLTDLKGVWQLAKVDDNHALILTDSKGVLSFVVGNATSFSAQPTGSLDLKAIVLP